MTAILGALSSGHTAQQILRYLSQHNPKLAQQISGALNAGHTLDHVLRYMSKHEKSLGKLIPEQKESKSANLYKTAQNEIHPSLLGGAKAAAMVLGVAGAATGAGLALNAGRTATQAAGAATNAIPPISPSPTPPPQPVQPGPGIGQQIQGQVQAPIANAMQPTPTGQIQGAAQAVPQGTPQQTPVFEQLLGGVDPATLDPAKQEQLKFLAMISDQLQTKGKTLNDPEFKNLAKKVKNVIGGKPDMITEENARFNAGQAAKESQPTQQIFNPVEPAKIEKPETIQKGESVVTEDGNIAEVKGVSGNNFLIEENGKVRQVPMDSLRAEPEAIKKAKIVFDASKVPEDERSAALAFSVPMPDRSSIINMFHDGSYYVYRRKDGNPIEESIIKRIIEGQDIPMTTGETFMGSWNQGNGDSRGSASHKELTAMAQDATKEDDPTKPLIFEKITNTYTHGYIKEFMKLLKETNRMFSAKPKKAKK